MGSLSQKGLKSPPCSDLSSSYPWPHSPTAFLSAMRRILQPLQHQRLLQLLQLTLQQPQQTLQPQQRLQQQILLQPPMLQLWPPLQPLQPPRESNWLPSGSPLSRPGSLASLAVVFLVTFQLFC